MVYSDADYAEDNETRKPTTGYIFLNGNCPISWKSQLQKCVTLSTAEAVAEAEFVSLIECTKHSLNDLKKKKRLRLVKLQHEEKKIFFFKHFIFKSFFFFFIIINLFCNFLNYLVL